MNYKDLEKIINGRETPLMGNNQDGEVVIVEAGRDDNGPYYRTTTAQNNNWCRINTYYEEGSVTESFER